jgi:NADH dehydrogenase [ubiquinone] 1 alpha subcomplex assembly factor 7
MADLARAAPAAGRGLSAALGELITRRIRATGPITVAAFMGEALGHPRLGYYITRDPFGSSGDFTTAPEISQTFGELIGAWCAVMWRALGAPRPVRLVEIGPGRGTLMADALRATRRAEEFHEALTLHLIETSPVLRRRQAETLAGWTPQWHASWSELPDGPVLVIANELFDALPVRQFVRTEDGWRERCVGLAEDGRLTFLLDRQPSLEAQLWLDPTVSAAPLGSIAEVSPAGRLLARAIGERIATAGGTALVIDYGHAASGAGDTLQAVRRHRRHEVLDEPGSADLTTHVDFSALATAARDGGATTFGPITQRDLLIGWGIRERTAMLRAGADAAQRARLDAALHRLIDPGEMGTLFKALAIVSADLPAPPGFATGSIPGTEG